MNERPHVTVCALTFRRPQMLVRCLESLAGQRADGFGYSVLVVDNDVQASARQAVAGFAAGCALAVDYVVEPQQNIAMARNRAVASARGDWVAFIDDDEAAEPEWLGGLVATAARLGVDGVLGPVLPDFAGTAPAWLIDSGLCRRRSFPTGTLLTDPRYMRTGNVLFNRAIVPAGEDPFDPRWGRSGGEDADFFGRMLSRGRRFAWCDEARVHELVPPARQTLSYYVRRGLLRGVTEADRHPLLSVDSGRSVLAILAYGIAVPVLALAKPGLAARYAVSACDHLGKMLGRCGVPMPRERTF